MAGSPGARTSATVLVSGGGDRVGPGAGTGSSVQAPAARIAIGTATEVRRHAKERRAAAVLIPSTSGRPRARPPWETTRGMRDAARERLEAAIHEVEDRVQRSEFHRWAQLSLVRVDEGEVEVLLDAQEHHLNLLRTLHGGMIATLADTAMGLAVRTRHAPGTTHVTGSLTITYLSPGGTGPVRAIGRAVKAGRQMGYGEADVLDESGRLLARASATFIMLRARPEREGGPRPEA